MVRLCNSKKFLRPTASQLQDVKKKLWSPTKKMKRQNTNVSLKMYLINHWPE